MSSNPDVRAGTDWRSLASHGPAIRAARAFERTAVDEYWAEMTVNSKPFTTAAESAEYLQWRSGIYPLFATYMELYGDHSGDVVLDYGCGPGNDTVGFLIFSSAKKVVGIDVSEKALSLASHRIGLHDVDPARVDLVLSSDASYRIPIEDDSIDYLNCGGVIHHTTHPGMVLREFTRILRPGGRGRIMVYNRQSIFFHLWIAYQRQLVNGEFPGLDAETAFSKATDCENCPIARPYRPDDFTELCLAAGLEVDFVGGYFASMELDLMRQVGEKATADDRLASDHRSFLRELTIDDGCFYLYRGRTAGHGGVFSIRKPA